MLTWVIGLEKKIKTYKSNLKSRKKLNANMKNCESFKGFGYNNNNNISSSLTMADEVILFDLKSELIKVEGEKSRQSRTKNNLTKSILKNIFLNKVE